MFVALEGAGGLECLVTNSAMAKAQISPALTTLRTNRSNYAKAILIAHASLTNCANTLGSKLRMSGAHAAWLACLIPMATTGASLVTRVLSLLPALSQNDQLLTPVFAPLSRLRNVLAMLRSELTTRHLGADSLIDLRRTRNPFWPGHQVIPSLLNSASN